MESQIDLLGYINKEDINPKKSNLFRRRLKTLREDSFGCERVFQPELIEKIALSTYPQISPEFLKFSFHLPIKEDSYIKLIKVPRFGIYSLHDPKMLISINPNYNIYEVGLSIEKPKNLQSSITKQIYLALGLKEEKFGKLYRELRNCGLINIGSSFNGIVPSKTRKNIKDAEEIFDKSIYFIVETKPENWHVNSHIPESFIRDPLILGVFNEKCFLIDKFDTMRLEDYVAAEFTF